MIPLHTLCVDLAARETRSVTTPPGQHFLPAGEFAYLEFYCEDPNCDCRRVFIQAVRAGRLDEIYASINFGWETEAFYQKKMPWNSEGPGEIVRASLDPINPQSKQAGAFLALFQDMIANDKAYVKRFAQHYATFRKALAARKAPPPR